MSRMMGHVRAMKIRVTLHDVAVALVVVALHGAAAAVHVVAVHVVAVRFVGLLTEPDSTFSQLLVLSPE